MHTNMFIPIRVTGLNKTVIINAAQLTKASLETDPLSNAGTGVRRLGLSFSGVEYFVDVQDDFDFKEQEWKVSQ